VVVHYVFILYFTVVVYIMYLKFFLIKYIIENGM